MNDKEETAMKTYRIVRKTNPYLAQRCHGDKTYEVLHEGLALKEAYKILLDMYNEYADHIMPNWGMAVCHDINGSTEAYKTHSDGTRSFEWDSRMFEIEEENKEED